MTRSRPLSAYFLNCTLKSSPEESNTRALIEKVRELYHAEGVETDVDRVADFQIKFGVQNDMGDGDEWPKLYEKVKACDILVLGMPIWMGVRSSVAQLAIERLDGSLVDADEETGQYPFYNKVAGVVITGNEDGAHAAAETTLFNLSHFGFTVPANCDCYWVGEAGPGPSYIKAEGDRHLYTNRTARYLVANTVHMAKLLRDRPYTANLMQLDEQAEAASDTSDD